MAGEEARGLSRKSEVAAAIRYSLSRWRALLRYINEGRIGSTIMEPNAPSAPSFWAGTTTCSPAPPPVVSGPLRSIP